VRCCEQHRQQGEAVVALMQHHMAPAVIWRRALPVGTARGAS
jgi:hypothetical protein